jgi:hypothetical protein
VSKVFAYKVWVHIEGIDEGGDCVEGDDYYGPEEAGVFDTSDEAEDLQGFLVDVADEWRARRPSSQALLLAALESAVENMDYVANHILIGERPKGVSPEVHVFALASRLHDHAKAARAAVKSARKGGC